MLSVGAGSDSLGRFQQLSRFFRKWQDDDTLARLHDALYRKTRRLEGFEVLPKRWIVERTFAMAWHQPSPFKGFRAIRKNSARIHSNRHD